MPSPAHNGGVSRFSRARRQRREKTSPAPTKPTQAPAQSGQRDIVDLSHEARNGGVAGIDEQRESQLIKNFSQGSGLVKIHDGKKKGVHVTVHGIRGNPDVVKRLSEDSASKGHDVYTLAYDDNHQRLGKSSQGLADSLAALQKKHPGEPITLRTHSMGSRVGIDALRRLHESGGLKSKVNMENYGPVLGGFGSANTAALAPGPVAKLIPGATPGKDMGTASGFQKTLEKTQLPSNVRSTSYVGSDDALVDPNNKHFQRVQDGLNGQVKIVPGANHDNIMDRATGR